MHHLEQKLQIKCLVMYYYVHGEEVIGWGAMLVAIVFYLIFNVLFFQGRGHALSHPKGCNAKFF